MTKCLRRVLFAVVALVAFDLSLIIPDLIVLPRGDMSSLEDPLAAGENEDGFPVFKSK